MALRHSPSKSFWDPEVLASNGRHLMDNSVMLTCADFTRNLIELQGHQSVYLPYSRGKPSKILVIPSVVYSEMGTRGGERPDKRRDGQSW
jgi:hypothetical protein